MSSVINTNVNALIAQRNLGISSMMLAKSTERLSSGFRINRAGDDAAGLSIAEKLTAQIRGINQASRNAQDGISMIQTAEGALAEVNSMLQRVRELTIQASNGTLSAVDLTAIAGEVSQLQAEIDAITTRVKFNGQSLLTGSLSTAVDTGTSTLEENAALTSSNAVATIKNVNVLNAAAGTTYTITIAGSNVTLTATVGGSTVAQTLTAVNQTTATSQSFNFDKLGVSFNVVTTTADANNTSANLAAALLADTPTLNTTAGTSAATFQIGAEAGQTLNVNFDAVTIAAMSLTTAMNNFTGGPSAATASALLTAVDIGIDYVNSKRSNLGAAQGRLEHTINNLGVTSDNLAASRSRIRDVDMAAEMVQFTKAQILQQAGMAILAQANTEPQAVLQLLR